MLVDILFYSYLEIVMFFTPQWRHPSADFGAAILMSFTISTGAARLSRFFNATLPTSATVLVVSAVSIFLLLYFIYCKAKVISNLKTRFKNVHALFHIIVFLFSLFVIGFSFATIKN